MESIVSFFLGIVHSLGYPGLFLVMMLGSMGVPTGTEIAVTAAGALAATGNLPSVFLVGFVATVADILGAVILYAIGFFGGRPFVERYGKYVGLSLHKLDIAHGFYEKYGTPMVFIGRFLPFVRGVASLPAGISRMQKRYFLTYTSLGSAIFCFGLAYLGAQFGRHFDEIVPMLHRFSLAILAVVVAAAAAAYLFWNARRKQSALGAESGTTPPRS
jgi:membrane protein DedA with SNARE-associated domain